jgi:glycosyltransferase involved in cell wall biosynthesis
MKILMLNWRCVKNPRMGGAEIFTHNILKRLQAKGHEISQFSALPQGFPYSEKIDGINFYRKGTQYTVHLNAYSFFKKNKDKFDLVIDQINTIPFFTPFYVKKPRITLIHQLAQPVWKYQAPPIISHIGNFIEPHYLKFYKNEKIFTVSDSTKQDLIDIGCKSKNIIILPEGIEHKPLLTLPSVDSVKIPFSILYFGSVRPMKRVEEPIKAMQYIVKEYANAVLTIAGGSEKKYRKKLESLIKKLKLQKNVNFIGKTTDKEKFELMKKHMVLVATSVREGWGLIVTEANSMGTPAVVYDIHGLRDSTKHLETGLVCKENTPYELAENIKRLFKDKFLYTYLRKNAWKWSKTFSWDKTATEFLNGIYHFYPYLKYI